MSEGLISRQAAIDALIEWYGCEPTDIGAFENIIEKLPSAQPAPRWIPVSEKPIKNGEYLVTMIDHITHDRIVDIAGYGNFIHSNNGFHKADEVTAWMPLPTAYERSEDE